MKRAAAPPRDQDITPFAAILDRMCAKSSVAVATLVDAEGETVDYAGHLDPFDIRVMAAEWRIVLVLAEEGPRFHKSREIVIRATRHSYLIVPLSEGYALVARLPRHAFGVSHRALDQCVRELCEEAGLEEPWYRSSGAERWTAVEVQSATDEPLRPQAIWVRDGWIPLEVLGRYAADDLDRREHGYRVRTIAGQDFSLVRERFGVWFADDLPGSGRRT